MRILIAESGSGYGGTAKYLASLLPCLDKKKFYPEIVCYGEGPFIHEIRHQGYAVDFFPDWKFSWGSSQGFAGGIISAFRGLYQFLFVIPQITFWLKGKRIQLVHLNNEILTHIPLLLAAKFAGVKTLVHLHGWRPFTKMEKMVLPFVDQFISISESGARYFEAQLKGRKVIAVANGILVPDSLPQLTERRQQKRRELSLDPRDRVFLIAGRLVEWKGQRLFIEALAKAAQTFPRIRGVVMGHDPEPDKKYLNALKAAASGLGIEEKVTFLDFQEDVWPMYAAADIIVHASTQPEPFGLVLLEAMACQRPVIASKAGGVKDIIVPDVSGLLTEPGDVGALARAMELLAGDEALAARLAQAGEKRVKEFFTMERNARQLEGVYLGL